MSRVALIRVGEYSIFYSKDINILFMIGVNWWPVCTYAQREI